MVRKIGCGIYVFLPAQRAPLALVVDDDEANREVLTGMLAGEGSKGIDVEPGQAALQGRNGSI